MLLAAVKQGDLKRVHQLIDQQESSTLAINETDYKDRNALHLAVEHGHDDVAALLIDRDIDLAATDCCGFTALHFAAEFGRDNVVAQLIGKIRLSDAAYNGLTALHLAAANGHATIVTQLLGANLKLVDIADKRCRPALHFALENGHEEIVTILIESCKSNPDRTGETMLQHAIRSGHDRIVAQMLEQNTHLLDAKDPSSWIALSLAVETGSDALVARLLAARPALANSISQNELQLAVEKGHEKVVIQLLDLRRELVDAAYYSGQTVLRGAVSRGQDRMVACLLAYQPRLVDATLCWTALRAKGNSGEATLKLLLTHKPELIHSVDRAGNTILHHVFGPMSPRPVPFSPELLEQVWRLNPEALHTLNHDRRTPFHRAVRSDNKAAIELVLGTVSPDKILRTFVKCKRECPLSIMDLLCEPLRALHRDVVGMVLEYLGLGKRKRERDEHTEDMAKKIKP